MTNFINRLRRGGTVLKERAVAFKKRSAERSKIREQFAEVKRVERNKALEKRASEIIEKQNRITLVRKAQLERARAEANILKAKAQGKKAREQIIGTRGARGVSLNLGGPVVSPKTVKKKRTGPTPGLGRFRVL